MTQIEQTERRQIVKDSRDIAELDATHRYRGYFAVFKGRRLDFGQFVLIEDDVRQIGVIGQKLAFETLQSEIHEADDDLLTDDGPAVAQRRAPDVIRGNGRHVDAIQTRAIRFRLLNLHTSPS